MGVKREVRLRTSFIKFVAVLGIFIISLILLNYFLFIYSPLVVYPANYSEKIIQGNFKELKETNEVTTDLLTPMSNFGVYSDDGEYLYGNFSDKDKNIVWSKYIKDEDSLGLKNYTTSINREEGILLIKYPLTIQYKTGKMRSTLPNAENTMLILFLLELITVIFLMSSRFAKQINKELNFLLIAAKKIEERNLEFDVGKSNIREMNIVLEGIDKMKKSLKVALREQWVVEQQKREQISALAHDVKTPLTIVRGNVELLKETDMTREQESYCEYIEESSERMEKYIQSLLFVSKGKLESHYSVESVAITELLNSLVNQGESLGRFKNIKVVLRVDTGNDIYVKGHSEDIERVLMNIISNAVDFSPKNSTIKIISTIYKKQLIIKVIDEGQGFTKKMLKHGKEQFAIADESRTKGKHHGLGLYIADNIIKKYNGEIILGNNVDNGGIVIVKIPLIEPEIKNIL